MARKASDPELRALIVERMQERGEMYEVPSGTVVYPGSVQDGPGKIVQASDAERLRNQLDLEHIALNKFRNALGSLMYHYRKVMRCHIDGKRHFKLLSA